MIQKSNKVMDSSFAKEVLEGLSQNPKRLSSKYFYDETGDALFQKIMGMPEYYLTDAEKEIFEISKEELAARIADKPVDLIELGAGDGTKTRILLKKLYDEKEDFRYIPSDISENILAELEENLKREMPDLKFSPLPGDYFSSLAKLPERYNRKRVFLYLGSNIGNLEQKQAIQFLKFLRQFMQRGDQLLIGFDLKKEPQKVLDAYNDPHGYTAAFNLNLLHRINRELKANFLVDKFIHWESYDPLSGAARSYIVSKTEQEVFVGALEETFHFRAWEAIQVELSQKYDPLEIDDLAWAAGFKRATHLFDSQNRFVDSLWNF